MKVMGYAFVLEGLEILVMTSSMVEPNVDGVGIVHYTIVFEKRWRQLSNKLDETPLFSRY